VILLFCSLVVVVALVHIVVREAAVALEEFMLSVLSDASDDRVLDLGPLASDVVRLVKVACAGDVVDWVGNHLEDPVLCLHIVATEIVEDSATVIVLFRVEQRVCEVVDSLGVLAPFLNFAKILDAIDGFGIPFVRSNWEIGIARNSLLFALDGLGRPNVLLSVFADEVASSLGLILLFIVFSLALGLHVWEVLWRESSCEIVLIAGEGFIEVDSASWSLGTDAGKGD